MNKYIQIFIVIMFFLGMLFLLSLYFDTSNLLIAIIIGLGLLGGILQRFFVGCVIPNRIIFRARFIVYGIGFGIMIGLLLFLTKSIKDQSFAIQDLVKWLLISIPISIIGNGMVSYLRFRKLKKKTIGNHKNKNEICDFAVYIDSEYKATKGLLVLSVDKDKLAFYSMSSHNCLFETPLSDLNPEIKKSKFMSIPNGFSFQNKMFNVNIAFPLYWIELIRIKDKKRPHNMR